MSKITDKTISEFGNFKVIQQKAGFYSIYDNAAKETMHSVIDPMVESKLLYVDQSALREQLSIETSDPLVIWDVGLGAATNVIAAIEEIELIQKELVVKRNVQILSFENDLDSLRLAIQNPTLFPYIKHPAVSAIVNTGCWEDQVSAIKWKLLEGDFLENWTETPAPDIIYYDMYSLKFNDKFWSMELFKRIYDYCKGKNTRFITYTVSTRTRAALLAAGFSVCYGIGSGPKDETTLAFKSLEDVRAHPRPLDERWLKRYERSSAKVDDNLSVEEKEDIHKKVVNHRQFAG